MGQKIDGALEVRAIVFPNGTRLEYDEATGQVIFVRGGGVPPVAFTQTYSTADKTHAALTAADLTDNTGAAPDVTIENVPASAGDAGGAATVSAAANVATVTSVNTALTAVENNVSDLAAQCDALLVDLTDLKQLVNSVIDDLQALGLLR